MKDFTSNNMLRQSWTFLFTIFLTIIGGELVAATITPPEIDAIAGQKINLPCKFKPNQFARNSNDLVYYWQRRTSTGLDLAASNAKPIGNAYSLDYSVKEGKYDLIINSANYERDNGQFECRIIESVSGTEIVSQTYTVTILIPPKAPKISPVNPVAKEGEDLELTCSSDGGSPDPIIEWFRGRERLEAKLIKGGDRDTPTMAILNIRPGIEDNRAKYRCVVWNRAIAPDRKLETSTTLTVHYIPRVEVGPYNPLNVLVDSDATMTCKVDANPPAHRINWFKDNRIISHTRNHTIVKVLASDTGRYSCVADNGVKGPDGSPGKGFLILSVQYPPNIRPIPDKEAKMNDLVEVTCDVDSNPPPDRISWTRKGDNRIIQEGKMLIIHRITASEAGEYVCTATNTLRPSGSRSLIQKSNNATVVIRVKHRPGKSHITPKNPISVAGKSYTLTCHAEPSGWPQPKYRWWKEDREDVELSDEQNYTFISVHVSLEGRYFCRPQNELGVGSNSSVYLSVQESPSITIPMPPIYMRNQGDRGFTLTCRARGKPKPSVKWTHNGIQINPTDGLFQIETEESVKDGNVGIIQSVLKFDGSERISGALTAADRGKYRCSFDNGIGDPASAESFIRIAHSPILRHTHNKVAFDVGEKAILECRMSAYPKPKFRWSFANRILDPGYGYRYKTNVSEIGDDVYSGTLYINDTRSTDYGDYTCRAYNSDDDEEKTIIKLVPKSAPDQPSSVEVVEIVSDAATLRWKEGFNGGFHNTEFIVTYGSDGINYEKDESCRNSNPCRIIGLKSQKEYWFKVRAINPRGKSPQSEPIWARTKVNLEDMPHAVDAYFDSKKSLLTFRLDGNNLKLSGKVEAKEKKEPPVEYIPLVQFPIVETDSGEYDVHVKESQVGYSDMRILLCLQSNHSWCGYPTVVKIDLLALKERSSGFSFDQFITVLSICGSLALVAVIILLFCCWKKHSGLDKKEYDGDVDDLPKGNSISPPYYPGNGHDNKGVDEEMIAKNGGPPPMYTSSNGHHIAQNYYLTGDVVDPSPGGSQDTGQSELWMKSEQAYDPNYGSPPPTMDTNMYPYSYYPSAEEYQQYPNDDPYAKNSFYAPYYDDGGHPAYGSTGQPGMMSPEESMNESHLMANIDPSKLNHISFGEDSDYPDGNPSGRVIREIIV